MKKFALPILLIILSCSQKKQNEINLVHEAISLLGDSLYSTSPGEKILVRYNEARSNYEKEPNAENLIWLGRFTAYIGSYNEAVKIFSEGIKKYPRDPRFYRHRGHRLITIRKFDDAIADLKIASELIANSENEIEPDGMPNAKNIPVSTLHGNIWYHLGLAYYLNHDFENALNAYRACLNTSSNFDNVVSSSNWLYMILRRLGRKEEANNVLDQISADMQIIENFAYHKICLFYKGDISMEELQMENGEPSSNDAINYSIGNWYLYNDELEKSKIIYLSILEKDSWSSFGYIASESDFNRIFQ